MSRCFPFPPPGYEPKDRPDDVNLIIKEKKEKKKKKHKDKEKKERSKNKENEGNEGDHKEDKKRKREKDKDKRENKRKKEDNQISSEGKKTVGFLENQYEGARVTDSKPTDAICNQGAFPESGKRIINDGGALGNQMVQKITVVEKSKVNLDKIERSKMANGQSSHVDARRLGTGYAGNCKGEDRIKIEGGSCQVDKVVVAEKSKINLDKTELSKMANGQSFNVDARRLGNGYARNSNGEDRIKIEGGSCQVDKVVAEKSKINLDKTELSKMANGQSFNVDARRLGNGYARNCNIEGGSCQVDKVVAEKSKINLDKTERSKMANGQSFNVDARRLGNGYTGNCNGENRIKIEGGSCQVDKVEKRMDGNGRNGYGTVFGKGDGCKNEDMKAKERNGYRNVGEANGCKSEDQNKNTRALEKEEKEKMAQHRKEKIKQGSSDSNFLVSANNLSKNGQGKLTKHKELNGFINGVRPNNTSRPVLPSPVEKGAVINNQKGNDKIPSPQSVINNHGLSNGHLIHIKRKMEPCPPPTNTVAKVSPIVKNHSAADKVQSTHPLPENGRTIHKPEDIKVLRTNGSVEGGKHTTSSKPSVKSNKLKHPHPDLKYLSSILCVPSEVELPQYDDQDWLFGCKDKRPKLGSSPNQCTKEVWAEAVHLESVDITALPYVVRF